MSKRLFFELLLKIPCFYLGVIVHRYRCRHYLHFKSIDKLINGELEKVEFYNEKNIPLVMEYFCGFKKERYSIMQYRFMIKKPY